MICVSECEIVSCSLGQSTRVWSDGSTLSPVGVTYPSRNISSLNHDDVILTHVCWLGTLLVGMLMRLSDVTLAPVVSRLLRRSANWPVRQSPSRPVWGVLTVDSDLGLPSTAVLRRYREG